MSSFSWRQNLFVFLMKAFVGTLAARDDETRVSDASIMTDAGANEKFSFLQKQVSDVSHSKQKTFYCHLFGVYRILYSKGERRALCDAGLYHSIYGTEFFEIPSERKDVHTAITREKIRSMIGNEAEALVYLFCSMKKDRFQTIVDNSLHQTLTMQLDLCKLEYANLLDQNYDHGCDEKLKILSDKIRELKEACRLQPL
jgi:hypothetical protein